jgi:hypothetical protein
VYGFFLSLAFVVFINTLFLLWIVSVVAGILVRVYFTKKRRILFA